MKNNDYYGLGRVISFELKSRLKSRTFKIVMTIVCLISLCSMPGLYLFGLLFGDGADDVPVIEETVIERAALFNGMGIEIDPVFDKESIYRNVEVDITEDEDGSLFEKASVSEDVALSLWASYDDRDGIVMKVAASDDSIISEEEREDFASCLGEAIRQGLLDKSGITESQAMKLGEDIEVDVLKVTADGLEEAYSDTDRVSMDEYMGFLFAMMFIFMFVNMSGSSVAGSVASEKSSRVIEYLLVNARPLALLAGKIVSAIVICVIQISGMLACGFVSQLLLGMVTAGSSSGAAADIVASGLWAGITIPKLIISVLAVAAGVAFYSIIAGVSGASVSKIDELGESMKIYSAMSVIFVYVDMALCISMLAVGSGSIFMYICLFVPFTGAFIIPVLLLLGYVSELPAIIALLILIAAAYLALKMAALVYEAMILFQGNRLKIGDIVKLAKLRDSGRNSRRGADKA
ncbi:ABC transporter permease [Butyrivibrio sp. MC2013]|uniref:ABC transporter permease n=1 Tax=Butyrivibrio sp. MC2013 TaxID=1280686 RepID=UPI000418A7D0|nr:ABC transporter permease [Butyrivibrio sp. MC2013]